MDNEGSWSAREAEEESVKDQRWLPKTHPSTFQRRSHPEEAASFSPDGDILSGFLGVWT